MSNRSSNAKKLTRGIKTGDTLGFGEHALVEFSVSMDSGWAEYKIKTLNLRKANFWLFRALVQRIPWETTLRDKGVNER